VPYPIFGSQVTQILESRDNARGYGPDGAHKADDGGGIHSEEKSRVGTFMSDMRVALPAPETVE
jgi:hypothetical protein